jgi:hypothetical protein
MSYICAKSPWKRKYFYYFRNDFHKGETTKYLHHIKPSSWGGGEGGLQNVSPPNNPETKSLLFQLGPNSWTKSRQKS